MNTLRYLLDSNVVIAALNNRLPVQRRLADHPVQTVALSAIVLHELYLGVYNSRLRERNRHKLTALQFPVLPFDAADADLAGKIRATLKTQGTPIGPYDVLIAAQALARNLTLITHNTREFARVPGLRVEDWL